MQVNTQRFGTCEVDQSDIFELHGLVGFDDLTRWTLLTVGTNASLMWLQSVEDPDIAFPVAYPEEFHPRFICELSDEDAQQLSLSPSLPLGEAPVQILALTAVDEDIERSTINLRAPVIVNTETMRGGQYLNLAYDEDGLRTPLWENVRSVRLQSRLLHLSERPAELVEAADRSAAEPASASAAREPALSSA